MNVLLTGAGLSGAPPAVTLLQDLVEYWKLDEASGNRAGYNGNTAVDNGAIGSAAGLFGTAASFTGSTSQWFDCGDIFNDFSGDRWIHCWANSASLAAINTLVSKWGTTGERQYNLDLSTTPRARIRCSIDGTANVVDLSGSQVISSATWYMVDAVYYAQTDDWAIITNASTRSTDTTVGGQLFVGTNHLLIGLQSAAAPGSNPMNGMMQGVGLWNKAPSQLELDYLFNTGAGRHPV